MFLTVATATPCRIFTSNASARHESDNFCHARELSECQLVIACVAGGGFVRYTGAMNWAIYAVLSAFFASLVAIFGKIGIKGVDSNLAVALRTIVIVLFAWGIVAIQGNWADVFKISKFSYVFIILSALATGLSWLFYYKALQLGEVSRVAPIDKLSIALTIILAFVFLAEKPTAGNLIGGALVTAGVLATVLIK